eukprot:TRINITY_DN29657_c0_g1_i1.p1 TRINITY_DN29657_c0_g1~~TRINITY_DN29657_c0_g1_i1.p1  ORF type:complete len:451 (+),score=59.47 TRINITY_DN29657_c0_g1_i1:189-1541(+)
MRPSLALRLLLPWASPVAALVDCSKAPVCAERRREECDPNGTVANSCGKCLDASHGGAFPANTMCVENNSCALIYTSQKGCPADSMTASRLPFVVPFNSCSCDVDGKFWPTAVGMCAAVDLDPQGTGFYRLLQCRTNACDLAKCVELARWSPLYVPYNCEIGAVDSYVLSDGCVLEGATGGPPSMAAYCGQVGLIPTTSEEEKTAMTLPLNCTVAPECPQSVLRDARLEQTCCRGTMFSNPMEDFGLDKTYQAPGFCDTRFGLVVGTSSTTTTTLRGEYLADLKAILEVCQRDTGGSCRFLSCDPTRDATCVDGKCVCSGNKCAYTGKCKVPQVGGVHVEEKFGDDQTAEGCPVRTSGLGWTGCMCLDDWGLPVVDRICTVTCKAPDCPLEEGGLPETPERWKTSQVPEPLLPKDKEQLQARQVAGVARGLGLPVLTAMVALQGLLTLVF